MMKKLLATLIALTMVAGLAACASTPAAPEATEAPVAAATEAQTADQLRAKVRNDISVQVGRHQDVVVERVLQQPHAHRIDVGLVHGYLGVVLRHFTRAFQEKPVGRADHVGLVDHRHLFAAELAGVIECGADDAQRALARIDLARNRVVLAVQPGKRGKRF